MTCGLILKNLRAINLIYKILFRRISRQFFLLIGMWQKIEICDKKGKSIFKIFRYKSYSWGGGRI